MPIQVIFLFDDGRKITIQNQNDRHSSRSIEAKSIDSLVAPWLDDGYRVVLRG
jgi:hypothetical protein